MKQFKKALAYFGVAFVVAFVLMSFIVGAGADPEAMTRVHYTETQFWGSVLAVSLGFGLIGFLRR